MGHLVFLDGGKLLTAFLIYRMRHQATTSHETLQVSQVSLAAMKVLFPLTCPGLHPPLLALIFSPPEPGSCCNPTLSLDLSEPDSLLDLTLGIGELGKQGLGRGTVRPKVVCPQGLFFGYGVEYEVRNTGPLPPSQGLLQALTPWAPTSPAAAVSPVLCPPPAGVWALLLAARLTRTWKLIR